MRIVNYEEIRRRNIEEYGKGTRHLAYLADLYTKRTHFLYELLQNAEDAIGRRSGNEADGYVEFRLFLDCLEFRHNGEPFDESNILGICGIGEGTKGGDFSQIGKFGIGFKSVYAYTLAPRIHSGGKNFEIRRFVEPHQLPLNLRLNLPKEETCIVLPFDNEPDGQLSFRKKVPPKKAEEEISVALKNLGLRTLLFLHHIKKIRWILPDGTQGCFLRQTRHVDAKNIRYVDVTDGDVSESWIIFSSETQVVDEDDEKQIPKAVVVEVAFLIYDGKIREAYNTELVVFFPTEKKTCIGFLVQSFFKTNPSRTEIKDVGESGANKHLVYVASQLAAESLESLRELGLLTVESYNALPLREQDFPPGSPFRPFYESIRQALREKELLPADDGCFVSAINAKIARSADLRELLNNEQLTLFFESPSNLKWLAGGVTQDRTPELKLYLTKALSVEEVTPESFARRISEQFLSDQTDDWFVEFYGYLSDQKALWRPPRSDGDKDFGLLRNKAILRLEDNSLSVPFINGKLTAFLPPPDDTDFPIVKRKIAENEQAKDFLKSLGLSEPDLYDEIVEFVLPKYANQVGCSVSENAHLLDIRKILRVMRSDSEAGKTKVINAARQVPFLKSINLYGKNSYRKPEEIYSPRQELKIYFCQNSDVWFLDELDGEQEWQVLGVATKPRFNKVEAELDYSTKIALRGYNGHTRDIATFDYYLEGLENFLSVISSNNEECVRTEILWKFLSEYFEQSLFVPVKGEYQWFWYQERSACFDANWLKLLRNREWLPNVDGKLAKPSEVCFDDLPDVFVRNERLPDLLKMKKKALKDLDQDPELPAEVRLYCINNLAKILELMREPCDIQRPPQLENPVVDPVRRRKGLLEARENAPEAESIKRERVVQLGLSPATAQAKAYLRPFYTHDDKMMYCQCCRQGMPFLLDNHASLHYFEAVQCVKGVKKRYFENRLALCPNCAAKYKHARQTDDETILNLLLNHDAADTAPSIEIPISLVNHEFQLFFVGKHWFDLKTMLSSSDDRSSDE